MYLGYPNLNLYRDTRLESALDVIGADVDAKAEVETIMADLATINTNLAPSGSIVSSAGIARADEVEWFPSSSSSGVSSAMEGQYARGRNLCGRLSTIFGVPLYGDYFGTGGYLGDSYMGVAHQYGGVIKLG